MIEKQVEIVSAGNTLSASLCLPDGEGIFPAVLMVHGSGPLDRDENMPSQKLDIFNTLAHDLAAAGIASLRYDKRGCGRSTGDFEAAGHLDLVDDAEACLRYLEGCGLFAEDRLYALGHSEGSIIIPQIAVRRPRLAGIILLSPFFQDMVSILRRQAAQLDKDAATLRGFAGTVLRLWLRLTGSFAYKQDRLIRRVESSRAPVIRYWLKRLPARWFRELFQLDPPAIFKQVACPSLVIGGDKDIQCDPADVQRIAGAVRGEVEAHLIKDLSHVLRLEAGEPSFFRYPDQIRRPMEPSIAGRISEWIKRRSDSGASMRSQGGEAT